MVRQENLLDAVLIVKDEMHHLPTSLTALEGLKPLLGSICVYDTGSTDGTPEYCEERGCLVERGYWDDDFARARNAAAEMSSAEWCLHIDADEEVVADPERLRTALHALDGVDIVYFVIRSWNEGRSLGDAQIGRLVRRSSTRFIGRVHEHAAAATSDLQVSSAIMPSDIMFVTHQGYSGEGTLRRKAQRNVAISESEVADCRREGAPESELQLSLIHRVRANAILERWEAVDRDLLEVRSLKERLNTRKYAGELLVERALGDGDLERAAGLLAEMASEGSDPQWMRWRLACLCHARGEVARAWQLMSGVDSVVTGMGESVSPVVILMDRARMALDAEHIDDAVAAALLLAGRHGRVDVVPFLIQACSQRPPEVLADLLGQLGSRHAPAVESALRSQGEWAARVADIYAGVALAPPG